MQMGGMTVGQHPHICSGFGCGRDDHTLAGSQKQQSQIKKADPVLVIILGRSDKDAVHQHRQWEVA